MDDSDEKVVPVEGVLGKEVDPVNEVLGLPSTQDLWDALSMKVSDKSHIIPVISQEMLAKRGLEGMSLFSVTADGQVCIDGVPEAEYFKQNHMEFLDMCNRRWAAAADAVTNGRPAVVAAGQFNRSLSA